MRNEAGEPISLEADRFPKRSKRDQSVRCLSIAVPSTAVALVAGWATLVVLSASFAILDQWVVPDSVPRPPGALLYQFAIVLNGLIGIAVGAFFGARCWRKLSLLFLRLDSNRARRKFMSNES